jgi:hypothetical protein
MSRFLVVVLACCTLGTAYGTQTPNLPGSAQRNIAQALDTYALGAEVSELGFSERNNFLAIARQFAPAAKDWIDLAPDSERPHRHQVAAAFLLELIHASLEQPPEAYQRLKRSIESYCVQLHALPAGPFEHAWMLASTALLAGAHDTELLLDGSTIQNGNAGCANAKFGHVCHALSRFPADSTFALAAVISAPRISDAARQPDDPNAVALAGGSGVRIGMPIREIPVAELLEDAVRRLNGLVSNAEVGAEASLRRGVLGFRLGRHAASLADLDVAARGASEPFVKYLAHLYSGVVLDAWNRHDSALVSYRGAVQTLPGALSGKTALASALFRLGYRDEASTVAADAFAPATEDLTDPWRQFDSGHYRLWPQYQRALRELVVRR